MTGVVAAEEIEFTESNFTTSHGVPWLMVSGTPNESGYWARSGYLVWDGVLYSLNIPCGEGYEKQAEALLYQWADSF